MQQSGSARLSGDVGHGSLQIIKLSKAADAGRVPRWPGRILRSQAGLFDWLRRLVALAGLATWGSVTAFLGECRHDGFWTGRRRHDLRAWRSYRLARPATRNKETLMSLLQGLFNRFWQREQDEHDADMQTR
jgi:hypothetical protein